jgi:hypothetical protein
MTIKVAWLTNHLADALRCDIGLRPGAGRLASRRPSPDFSHSLALWQRDIEFFGSLT